MVVVFGGKGGFWGNRRGSLILFAIIFSKKTCVCFNFCILSFIIGERERKRKRKKKERQSVAKKQRRKKTFFDHHAHTCT